MITKRVNEAEIAELHYKTKTQERINYYYFSCEWDKIIKYLH